MLTSFLELSFHYQTSPIKAIPSMSSTNITVGASLSSPAALKAEPDDPTTIDAQQPSVVKKVVDFSFRNEDRIKIEVNRKIKKYIMF